MSLFNDASLAMIPSAVKDGKLYSIRPTDGSGDFTFSRGTTATRVNASGLIEKGRENLFLQSNTFDTTWTTTNASVTEGQSGYDGSSDAWLLTATSTLNCRINQSISGSGVQTFSVYAKANTADFLALKPIVSGTTAIAYFDLSNGLVGTTNSAVIDTEIISIGSSWYRCSISFNDTNTKMGIFVVDADNSTAVTSGNSIYIQDSQLEQGLVATDYIETTTTSVQVGITDDLPRLDYSGGVSCPSLLLEPQRTNLFTQSEYFNSVDWTKTEINVTDNAVTSPEGIANAAKLIETTANSAHQISQQHSLSGNDYSFSVFVKKAERRYVSLVFSDFVRYLSQYTFDLEDGVLTDSFDYSGVTSTFVPEDYGNGWYRLTLSSSYASWSGAIIPRFYIENTATPSQPPSNNYAGDGTSGVYLYGAQFEAKSYPTSYIPTYGASVTRNADDMTTTFSSSLTSRGEVSVLFDIDGAYNSDSNSTGDNLAFIFSNDDRIIWNQNSIGFHRIEINVEGGTEYIYLTTSVDRVDRAKICIVVTASTYAMYVNGSLETSGSFTGTGNWTSADSFTNSMTQAIAVVPMEQLLYFPTALTDSEAIALTTL